MEPVAVWGSSRDDTVGSRRRGRFLLIAGAGILADYYATAVVERFLPPPWRRRFQRRFGNPGGQLMAWLPGWIVLETTGRRTGVVRRTPVGGRMVDGSVWIVAADPGQAGYVRNLEADPRVRVRIRGRWRTGRAELVPDDDSRRRMFRINPLNGLFIAIAGRDHLTIRVRVEGDR